MSNNPQRILSGRYQVVPRTIVLIIKDGRVLLQKAPESKKIFPGYYNGIGGHLERGEDIPSGASRELLEEAGITCEDLTLTGTIMIDVEEDQGILLFVFSGEHITGEPRGSIEGNLEWVSVNQLGEYKVLEDIPELVQRILNSRATGKMFHGKYLYSSEGKREAEFLEM